MTSLIVQLIDVIFRFFFTQISKSQKEMILWDGGNNKKMRHLTFLTSRSAEGSAPEFKEPVVLGCFAVKPFLLTYPFMQSLTKPFNRWGNLSEKDWYFQVTQQAGWPSLALPLVYQTESPNIAKTQPKHEETCLGSLPAGMWGRVQLLPPGPRGVEGQGRSGSRVPGASNQPPGNTRHPQLCGAAPKGHAARSEVPGRVVCGP